MGRDLNARVRLEGAGAEVTAVDPARMDVGDTAEIDVVVIDLDELGEVFPEGLWAAGRVIGFFSHVDATRAEAAQAVGIEAYPRGRFWRDLPRILGTTS